MKVPIIFPYKIIFVGLRSKLIKLVEISVWGAIITLNFSKVKNALKNIILLYPYSPSYNFFPPAPFSHCCQLLHAGLMEGDEFKYVIL
jgi:hypothetical protein